MPEAGAAISAHCRGARHQREDVSFGRGARGRRPVSGVLTACGPRSYPRRSCTVITPTVKARLEVTAVGRSHGCDACVLLLSPKRTPGWGRCPAAAYHRLLHFFQGSDPGAPPLSRHTPGLLVRRRRRRHRGLLFKRRVMRHVARVIIDGARNDPGPLLIIARIGIASGGASPIGSPRQPRARCWGAVMARPTRVYSAARARGVRVV